ncbi:unnamed protein product [Prorocentrum cordatum]|uniref:Uncharacterized protein n=1 Tax=Prorocentrum cordatum TaxID=2364126 RepID=A0ABN9UPA1_9DINO|nr:unnamed protein product [Polarella glacialis]
MGAPSAEGGAGPQTVSYAAFQKVCTQAGFVEQRPGADLKGLFLFLAAAFLGDSAGRLGGGFLSRAAWSALGGFSSRAVTGSPARLRRVLEERYGDLDRAFQHMHTAWLRRALSEGLRRAALEGMARALRRWEDRVPPGRRRVARRGARRRRADRWASTRPPRGAAAAPRSGVLPPLAAAGGRSLG